MRPVNCFVLLSVALSIPLVASSPAFADPVVINGGFEAGTVSFSNYFSGTAITGWTGSGNENFTGVDNLSGPDLGITPYEGSNAALIGPANTGGPGTLSQTITDNAGDTDSLNFFLASECFSGPSCNATGINGPDKTLNSFLYSIGGSSATLTNVAETGDGTDATYIEYSLLFLATGSDTISFSFDDNDDYFALDDVSVSVVTPAPIPEPSGLVLLGTGILGAAGMARRRFLAA